MLKQAKPEDNARDILLNEGDSTRGVWMPMAMADLYRLLVAIIRMFADKKSNIEIPTRSEVMAAWVLPEMAKALKADEDEAKALEMFESIKRLEKKRNGDGKHKVHG